LIKIFVNKKCCSQKRTRTANKWDKLKLFILVKSFWILVRGFLLLLIELLYLNNLKYFRFFIFSGYLLAMKNKFTIVFLYLYSTVFLLQAQIVTTIAGSGSKGSGNGIGTTASFNYPPGVAIDGSGNLYIADTFNHLIRKITPSGVVTTFSKSFSTLICSSLVQTINVSSFLFLIAEKNKQSQS
jgi:hypothetical protein